GGRRDVVVAAADAIRSRRDHRRHPGAGGGRLGHGCRRDGGFCAAHALGALMGPVRARRAALALLAAVAVYAVAAEVGKGRLPDRVWLGAHYVENVQLLPTWRSLIEEGSFLLESKILLDSALVSTRRVFLGLILGSAIGIALGVLTGTVARLETLTGPWLLFFRFTPALALLPLYVIWFGYG